MVEGGKRERYSSTGSSGPRAFCGLERKVELLFWFPVGTIVVPFFDGGSGVGGLSCSYWIVVRRRGWISDQYGSGL